MKKAWIILFSVIIIASAIVLGITIYGRNNPEIATEENVTTVGNKISEEIFDECTDEWEGLSENQKSEIIETNSAEEKISPNCLITLKRYYKGCNHTSNEYINVPEELVNKTREDLQNEYKDWEIETFSSSEIVLYKEFEGECGEHYVLKEKNGKIVVYRINENNEEVVFEETDISVDYLAENDRDNLNNGITVFGKEDLNQLIEDFE